MADYSKAEARQALEKGILDYYANCRNPNKSEQCLNCDKPEDIPCGCKGLIAIRQHLELLKRKHH